MYFLAFEVENILKTAVIGNKGRVRFKKWLLENHPLDLANNLKESFP
jgi:hypothetical protein